MSKQNGEKGKGEGGKEKKREKGRLERAEEDVEGTEK